MTERPTERRSRYLSEEMLFESLLALAEKCPSRWADFPLGRRLMYLRVRAGLNQRELAAGAAVSQGQVVRAEGGRDIRWSTLERLFGALGLRPLVLPVRVE